MPVRQDAQVGLVKYTVTLYNRVLTHPVEGQQNSALDAVTGRPIYQDRIVR